MVSRSSLLVVLSFLSAARAHWNTTSNSTLSSQPYLTSTDPIVVTDSSTPATTLTSSSTPPTSVSPPPSTFVPPPASTFVPPPPPASVPPPPPPTSASPSPSTSVSSPTPSSNSTIPAQKNPKRGLAFAAGNTPGDLINANQSSSVITWVYDWSNKPASYFATSNLEYVPMQWGSGDIDDFIPNVIAINASHALGFNEPDYNQESNILPSQAAALWLQYIEPLSSVGVRLGAPAVTASGTGKPWLTDFLSNCTSCTIDFIPLHWYGSGTEAFYNYLGDIHATFPNYPLWVTEFAETSSNDTEVAAFLNASIVYLDSLDWIERYSWFGFFRQEAGINYNLLDDVGGLDVLGQIYTGASTIHTGAAPSPDDGYTSEDGADDPAYPHVTTFPSMNSSIRIHSYPAISILLSLVSLVAGFLLTAV